MLILAGQVIRQAVIQLQYETYLQHSRTYVAMKTLCYILGQSHKNRGSRVQEQGGPGGSEPTSDKKKKKNASYLLLFEKRLGLRAVTYSYLTGLKAAATREGLSLSKLHEISRRGGRRREGDRDKEIQRYSRSSREDFLQSSPNHLSKRRILCTPHPRPTPSLTSTLPSLPPFSPLFKSQCGTNGERALEKFVSGKAGSLCS